MTSLRAIGVAATVIGVGFLATKFQIVEPEELAGSVTINKSTPHEGLKRSEVDLNYALVCFSTL